MYVVDAHYLDLFDWFTIVIDQKYVDGFTCLVQKKEITYTFRIIEYWHSTERDLESRNSSIVPVKDGKQILID